MAAFNIEPDVLYKGKYIVTVKIIIYRKLFGCYPDFLKDFETPRAAKEGYDTKFWYLVPGAENLSRDNADKLRQEYENKYAKLIETCENTGDWTKYPYKNATLIYHK